MASKQQETVGSKKKPVVAVAKKRETAVAKKQETEAPKKDVTWFDRSEHLAVRTCLCFCGTTYKSQARTIKFYERRTKRDKDGKEKTEMVTVNGCLSLKPCPKCKRVKIDSFQ